MEQGKAVSAVSEELGVHIKTMYRWLDEFKKDGTNAFPGKGKLKLDDDEIRKSKRKIADLEEENEILKKQRSSLQDTQNEIYIYVRTPL